MIITYHLIDHLSALIYKNNYIHINFSMIIYKNYHYYKKSSQISIFYLYYYRKEGILLLLGTIRFFILLLV